MHQTHRLSWDGAVDADGHILEPSDLWETYLDPQHRDRALRIGKDAKGLDVLEIDGSPSLLAARGMPSTLAAMGRGNLTAMARDPEVTYDNHAPPSATEPKARMDAVFSHTPMGYRVPLENPPSYYFRERCWISCDPDERTIPALAERFGADRFVWASDVPHADHTPEYILDLDELAGLFPEDGRRKSLGDNARKLFKITV